MAKDKVKPEKYDRDKRGKISLVRVFEEGKNIKGKIGPEWIELKPSLAGTGPEALGQLSISRREMQRTTVGDCSLADSCSGLGETVSLMLLSW